MRLIVIFLFLFFLAQPVLAVDAPVLISPSNNATVTSSKLEWQAPSYPIYTQGSPYVVQIKNIPTFTSQDDRYKTNTYYTPKLSDGIWYWRVKAKNSDGIWSDWSTTWSFNLTTSNPTTTPTPSSTPNPTPSSTSAGSSSSSSSFTISNTPSQVNSDQSFTVSINLSLPNDPNTTFYLKGAFRHPDKPSNYFGLTKVGSSWVKNSVTATSQLQITTDTGGNWTGNIEVQPDSEDSGFTGTGDYIFKVGRYTSTGSGPTWSNESTIKIVSVESSKETTAVSTSSNDSSSTINPSTAPSAKSKVITSSQSKSYDRLVYHNASVAAATTSASPPNIAVKVQQSSNFIAWIGTGLILTGISLFAYIYLRSSNLHETISNLFRKRN